MAKQPKEDKPTYILSYSRRVRLIRMGAVILLVGVALVHWALTWLDFVELLTLRARLTIHLLGPLLAAHLSLLLTVGAVAQVRAFLPDLSLADDGLAVRTLLGWRVIPWSTITAVRIIKFERTHQRLVLIQGRWARWSPWPRLVSMCLGAGFEPGVLMTTAIRDFKPLMLRIYQDVKKNSPEAIFDEDFFSLSARLVLETTPTLADLFEQARDEGWPLGLSAQIMGAVAGGLIVVQALVMLQDWVARWNVGGGWWKPVAIVGLVAAEWLIGALYLYAIAEFLPGTVEFREARLLYPIPQIPRALLTVPMGMFVATGVPFLAAMVGLAGVLWSVMFTALLVQQMYRMQSILPALVGGAFQALYQFIALAFIFSL